MQLEAARSKREKEQASQSETAGKVEADLRARLQAVEKELNRAKAERDSTAGAKGSSGELHVWSTLLPYTYCLINQENLSSRQRRESSFQGALCCRVHAHRRRGKAAG